MKASRKITMRMLASFFLMALLGVTFTSCETVEKKPERAELMKAVGTTQAELTAPPFVPRPVGKRAATKLQVEMEVIEQEMEMADGVTYNYWTFGGTVPGSFIRARVGDEIEFTLKNHPDNKLPHNIDLHAVTGQGGGAEATFVAPGREAKMTFKALNPGLYVYHCATAPVGMHIANGMYGLVLIEPAGGLPPVDKEYYIMQGDFYTEGNYGEPGLQAFDMNKAVEEDADYVVFNGHVGALTGEKAITAKVGETVRLFVGNGGPNLTSSFHVIGEIFDRVLVEGGDMVNTGVGTTTIPAGGAAIVEFKVESPGELVLVDHAIFRAFNKGALGILHVEGEMNPDVFTGQQEEKAYQPGTKLGKPLDGGNIDNEGEISITSLEDKMAGGKKIYNQTCFACHGATGDGIPGAFPPLAKSDYLNADVSRAIHVVKKGLSGEVKVNGNVYNSMMPAQNLSDEEIGNVLTYIYNNWGNNKTEVTEQMVKEALQ